MSDHLIHIVTKLTSGVCELDLGISESKLRKLELGRGDACFGDDDNIVLRTPRTICAHAPHTLLQKHTLLRRGLGFRGVGDPLPSTAGFVFDVCKMLCFRCVLPNNSLSPNNTVSPHFHTLHQTKKKCGHGVIQNASFNPKTILSGTGAGPRKKPSATPPCNSFK